MRAGELVVIVGFEANDMLNKHGLRMLLILPHHPVIVDVTGVVLPDCVLGGDRGNRLKWA